MFQFQISYGLLKTLWKYNQDTKEYNVTFIVMLPFLETKSKRTYLPNKTQKQEKSAIVVEKYKISKEHRR